MKLYILKEVQFYRHFKYFLWPVLSVSVYINITCYKKKLVVSNLMLHLNGVR